MESYNWDKKLDTMVLKKLEEMFYKGTLTIDKSTAMELEKLRQHGEFMKRLMVVGYNSMIMAHNLKQERAKAKEKSELPQSVVKVSMKSSSHRGHNQKAAGKGNKKKT